MKRTRVLSNRTELYEVETEDGAKLAIIGPRQPHPKYGLYLRIADKDGRYIGALDLGPLKRFAVRLHRWVGADGKEGT